MLPAEDAAGRLAFVTASAAGVLGASALELLALGRRFWWFAADGDRLVGLRLAGVPLEEFLWFPLLANAPRHINGTCQYLKISEAGNGWQGCSRSESRFFWPKAKNRKAERSGMPRQDPQKIYPATRCILSITFLSK